MIWCLFVCQNNVDPPQAPPVKTDAYKSITCATKKQLLSANITNHQADCLIKARDAGKPLDSWMKVQKAMKNSRVAVEKLQQDGFTLK